jgi:hypothetical protein
LKCNKDNQSIGHDQTIAIHAEHSDLASAASRLVRHRSNRNIRARYLSATPVASAPVNIQPNPKFQPVYDALADQMRRLYGICRVKIDGRELLRPCASPYYNGVWHDDFTWPHVGLPELQKTPVMRDTIAWLTDAMVDLPVVADRVEFDGTAVMSPGPWNFRPMSEEMTLHLPAAWTRLLSHAADGHACHPHRPLPTG